MVNSISNERIMYKPNNKLFTDLVDIIKNFLTITHNKFGVLENPSSELLEQLFEFSNEFLSKQISLSIYTNLKFKIGNVSITDDVYPMASCITYDYNDILKHKKALGIDNGYKFVAKLQTVVDTINNTITDNNKSFINQFHTKAKIKIRISLGLLFCNDFYRPILKDTEFLPQHIVSVILHEIGHVFYMLETTSYTKYSLDMIDDIYTNTSHVKFNDYNNIISVLQTLLQSITRLENINSNSKISKYLNTTNIKEIIEIKSEISKSLFNVEKLNKSNKPFDTEKMNYIVTVYINTVNLLWKNILFSNWYHKTIPTMSTTDNFRKDEELYADDFSIKNGSLGYLLESNHMLDVIDSSGNSKLIAKTNDLQKMNELTLSNSIFGKLLKVFDTSLIKESSGLYESPINRLDRNLKQLYPLLNGNILSDEEKKDLTVTIKALRIKLDKLRNSPRVVITKQITSFLSKLNNLFSSNTIDIKTQLTKDYTELQKITFDLIKNELPYQQNRLKSIMNSRK